MPMKNPVHPGTVIKHDCMDALNLNVTSAAKILGVSRTALSRVINGKASISPEIAIRVSKAFGSTPENWLRMQLAYDMSKICDIVDKIKIERYQPSTV